MTRNPANRPELIPDSPPEFEVHQARNNGEAYSHAMSPHVSVSTAGIDPNRLASVERETGWERVSV